MCHMKILVCMVLFDKGVRTIVVVMLISLLEVQIPQHALVSVLTIIPFRKFVELVHANQSNGRKICK